MQRSLKTQRPKYADRVSPGAAIAIAAILETMVEEVIRQASDSTAARKAKKIGPHQLTIAIRNDPDLDRLFKNVIIVQGGVKPMTDAELNGVTPKKKPAAAKKSVAKRSKKSGPSSIDTAEENAPIKKVRL